MKFLYTLLILVFSLQLSAQCLEQSHNSFGRQGWKSCTQSSSPISGEGESHWIKYDLGELYVIDSIQVWNHNVWGETGKGIRDVRLAYSSDNLNWTSAGSYTFDRAPGSWNYISNDIQYVGGIQAQYFLFTVLSTWDDIQDCAGIAEIKFIVGEVATSLNESVVVDDIQLFPNPTSSSLNLKWDKDFPNGKVMIYSSLGKLIQTYELDLNSNQMELSTSFLETGAYILKIASDNLIVSKGFVKL